MAHIMTTPWTRTGRSIAIEKAIAAIYERYFAKGPRWVAKHLPQRSEMQQYGDRVSAESREILLGDYGVEYCTNHLAHRVLYASRYRLRRCGCINRDAICAHGKFRRV